MPRTSKTVVWEEYSRFAERGDDRTPVNTDADHCTQYEARPREPNTVFGGRQKACKVLRHAQRDRHRLTAYGVKSHRCEEVDRRFARGLTI